MLQVDSLRSQLKQMLDVRLRRLKGKDDKKNK